MYAQCGCISRSPAAIACVGGCSGDVSRVNLEPAPSRSKLDVEPSDATQNGATHTFSMYNLYRYRSPVASASVAVIATCHSIHIRIHIHMYISVCACLYVCAFVL